MKNKKVLLVIILVFALLLGGAYLLYNRLGENVSTEQMVVHATQEPAMEEASPEGTGEETEAEGDVIHAPDFTVYDGDGNTVQLSQYFGKPIVLNFWASWCGPCQSEMPDFNEKYLEIGEDVHFVMVNMTSGRETMETAKAFIAEKGYEFPVLFDTESDAAMTYGAYSLPTSYFINADGHVIAQAVGAIDMNTLQTGIDMINN